MTNIALAIIAVAVITPAASARTQDRQTVPPRDRNAQNGAIAAHQAALSVRHAAANGTGAPQIGLNPDWPGRDYAYWEKATRDYPEAAAPYEPCVAKFLEAIETIKAIAPLTRRPAWDHSGPQINAAIREAKAAIDEGDACLNDVAAGRPRRPLLKGRVSQDEGTPPPVDATQPPATSSIPDMGGMLRGLAGAIDRLAPHYDMTRPHEGLRVINDIVISMGLGYVAKNLPGAVRAVMARRRGGGKVFGGSSGGGLVPASAGSWAAGDVTTNGIRLPGSIRQFPRPVFLQETADSCGASCARMVANTVKGTDIPEATLRNMLSSPLAPAEIKELQPLLRAAGVRTQYVANASVDDIARATANGRPALVHVGAQGNGHYMVVDGIVRDAEGKAFALLRDPTNLDLAEASSRELLQAAGHTSTPVVRLDDFKAMISGAALFVAR